MNRFVEIENIFNIKSIGYALDRVFPSSFVYYGESHPSVEIVYVKSGKLEVVEDENVYEMESGDLIIHAPMEFHRLKSMADTTPHVYNLSAIIEGNAPDKLYRGVFRLDRAEQDEFLRIFESAGKFEASVEPDGYFGQKVAFDLGSFIVRICREGSISNKLSGDNCAATYRRLVEIMNTEVCANLTLSDIAAKEHISVSYVKTLFYRYAGISAKSYYTSLRVKRATELLLDGVPANEIAEKMNFSSPNYFSLFFKNRLGVTPNEYKNKNRK